MDAVSICSRSPVAERAWNEGPARTVEGVNSKNKEKEKTHSSAWATASGSEAKATRGLNDVLMRILSVSTAQDTKIITLRKRTVAEGR